MPKEKHLCSFFNDFSFPLYAEKVNCLKPATSEVSRPREMRPSSPSRYEGPFHAKNNRNMNFYVCGATSGHNITAATCAVHSPAPAEFNIPESSSMISRPWNLGSRNAVSCCGRRGCGTVSHCCQALLVLLQKLILKGSKVPEAGHYERLQRKLNSKPFSCFGYVKWKRISEKDTKPQYHMTICFCLFK